MDVRQRLTRWALARPHALVVDGPGKRALRWDAEAELDRRRWPAATSPADADVLLVLGRAGPDLSAAVEVLWSQVPDPRTRVDVADAAALGAALDAARAALVTAPWAGAAALQDPWRAVPEPAAEDHGGMDHGGMDHGGGGHEHMHHGGDVAGLAMAGTAPDRDGLELDALQVSLGPWLPGWPTGLVVHAGVQGDVLTGAHPMWLDADEAPETAPAPADVEALDVLASFLLVAGWPVEAARARAARSAVLAGAADGRRLAVGVARRVAGSRALAWSVRGLGRGADGDVHDRVLRWCAVAADPNAAAPHAVDVGQLADLLDGEELAAARLTVASASPRPAPSSAGTAHAGAGHA